MIKIAFLLLLIGCLALFVPLVSFGQNPNPKTVVARFGGECQGTKYRFSARLKKQILKYKQKVGQPCNSSFCEGAFVFDLDGDRSKEYFVRLSCGGTGNCTWGIFSESSAKLRGIFTAWFFFIHKRTDKWSRISTHTREGGTHGVVASLAFRRTKYIETAQREESAIGEIGHPFLERMGMPRCP